MTIVNAGVTAEKYAEHLTLPSTWSGTLRRSSAATLAARYEDDQQSGIPFRFN